MSVIIFGGSGFIGTHLIEYLSSISNDILINFDLVDNNMSTKYYYIQGDIREKIKYFNHTKSLSAIYNLAAIHKTPDHKDYEYFETNMLGAENVCNFARKKGINTIVFTSSIAPYGSSEEVKYENTLPTPNTPYGISKLVAEEIHKRWQSEDSKNRKLIIVRPGVVFGIGERGNFTRLYKSLKKNFFFYPGRKDTYKASIYVKDLIRLMFEMVEKESSGVHIYNMCYSNPYTIKEIVKVISGITGVSDKVPLVPGWLLKSSASLLYGLGRIVGKKILNIHPDRVQKLMISTNISGENLLKSGYQLKYSLKDAINDWYKDCNYEGLY